MATLAELYDDLARLILIKGVLRDIAGLASMPLT